MYPSRPTCRSLVLLLSLALLALAAPANAALPGSTPTQKLRCANGKTAKAWATFAHDVWEEVTSVAADNPCKGQWVRFDFAAASETNQVGRSLMVAPGQRLNWDRAAVLEWGLGLWEKDDLNPISLVDAKDACVSNSADEEFSTNYDGILFLNAKDVRSAPECGQRIPKYSANHYAETSCPSSDGTIRLAWKTEGTKIVKIVMSNSCAWDDALGIAWWKLDNGRTVGVWVDPGDSVDLWKADFGKLPVTSKDGRVRLKTYPYADQEDAFRSDAKNRPVYYNGFVHDDTVSCNAGQKSC